jgi:transposase-like protein
MSGRKGSVHYAIEVKREAVRLVEEERLSYAEVAKRLKIRKAERIERWVAMYRQEGELSFLKPKGRPRKSESEQSELERLRMENALLKKFHSELRELERAQRNIGRSSTTKKNST